jgi:hypothetical protein
MAYTCIILELKCLTTKNKIGLHVSIPPVEVPPEIGVEMLDEPLLRPLDRPGAIFQ